MAFLEQKGPLEQIFAKCKQSQILIYATFVHKESIDRWFDEAIPHWDPNLKGHCGTLKFGNKMLFIMRDSEEVDESKHKHSSKTLKKKQRKLLQRTKRAKNSKFRASGLKSLGNSEFSEIGSPQLGFNSLHNSPEFHNYRLYDGNPLQITPLMQLLNPMSSNPQLNSTNLVL